jgi:hypothetical protein
MIKKISPVTSVQYQTYPIIPKKLVLFCLIPQTAFINLQTLCQ